MKKIAFAVAMSVVSGFAVAGINMHEHDSSHAKNHDMMGAAMKAENGLISKKSHHSVKVTLDRLEAALKKKGIGVALRWSHDEKGKSVGIPLRPTELLMFGNPKLGTHMFTSNQTAGIDLPLKALAWEDEKGQVWLTYNDPAYIAKRHHITDRDEILKKMSAALDNLSTAATQP